MHHKEPRELALDALNALLELVGLNETIAIIERFLDAGERADGARSRESRFADGEVALLSDPSARDGFLVALPAILREHRIYEDYPEIAVRLAGPSRA